MFGNGSVSVALPVTGTSGTNVFEFADPRAGSTFGGNIFGQPTAFGVTPPDAGPPPVTTGTFTPPYSDFMERDPLNPSTILQYQSITAMPAYRGTSLEELRAQDYQQNRKPLNTTQQPPTGSIFGAFREQQSTAGTTLDPSKVEYIEEILRKFLLGEELADTQFHLFSARSPSSGRVMKPRVLCANNALLAKNSKYFVDLLSSDINPSDPSLVDLTGDNDVPSNARLDEYGYESDSDLEDCDVPISSSKVSVEAQSRDGNELYQNGLESASLDTSVMYPERSGMDRALSGNNGEAISVASNESVVETVDKKDSGSQNAMRLRSLGSRHVLVKDTAFQTWYTLLNYLCTGKVSFLPLSSITRSGNRAISTSPLDGPRCSAKSMYRLATKVGLENIRNEAFSYIRSNLTEHNILKELSCSLVSRHPQLLEMELDTLYSYIASPTVVANFASFARRIVHEKLPHAPDIIIGIHTRLLKKHHPFSLIPGTTTFPPSFAARPVPVNPDMRAGINVPEDEATGENKPRHADQRDVQSRSLPSCSVISESTPGPWQAPADMAASAATPTKEQGIGGKNKAAEKRKKH